MAIAVEVRKQVLKKWLIFCILCFVGISVFSYFYLKPSRNAHLTRSVSLCSSLRSIAYADDLGVIKKVVRVPIPQIKAPHNPGLISYEDGFLLVFRYDIKEKEKISFGNFLMPFRTCIGAVKLDGSFQSVSPVNRVDTKSDFSEDPRLFQIGTQVYITYNDIEDNLANSRTIHMGKLDPDTLEVSDHVNMAQNYQRIEKNWIPFVNQENGEPKLHFEYSFNPHVILRMDDFTKNDLTHLVQPNHIAVQKMPWKNSWGTVRGGTPPILVDGQYLSFFHSFFREKKKIWYVMGAYTFEPTFPFRITACSSAPIQFHGIYDTPVVNTACSDKYVIFPSGAVLAEEEGREVLHIACGENDCAIKIITFDKEALLKSLQPVPLYQKK
jgi:predicted GH43/DUF377 family glycosyl hydrolase